MRVLIVEDHALMSAGLRAALMTLSGWTVVGEARTAREAFALAEETRPNLVIMDLEMPGMDGATATRELRWRVPEARILILSVHEAVVDVHEAFQAGADGFAFKSESVPAILSAAQTVALGERRVPPPLLGMRQLSAKNAAPSRPPLEGSDVALAALSSREREVFRLACEGLSNSEVATQLCISRKTVETHRHRIQKKLGLRNAAEMVRFAAHNGLLRSGFSRGRVRALPARPEPPGPNGHG